MLLVWQFTRAAGDGLQLQVLNPNLELIWKSAIVVPVTVGTVCSSAVWMRRTWTMPLAVVNASANWIAAVVTVSLAAEGILFTPPVPAGPGVQNDYRHCGSQRGVHPPRHRNGDMGQPRRDPACTTRRRAATLSGCSMIHSPTSAAVASSHSVFLCREFDTVARVVRESVNTAGPRELTRMQKHPD